MLTNQICKKCFKEMRFGFRIKDEIWNKLHEKWRERVLCMECFLDELEKEVPKQEICLEDFDFLAISGEIDNNDFGGTLIDNV